MDRSYIVSTRSLNECDHRSYDVVIIGSGIAGMTVALSLDPKLKVGLVSKEPIMESSTYKAQGGMAIAIGPDDSPLEHIADTLRVGQGLGNQEAVDVLVRDGSSALDFLQSLGTNFDHGEKGLSLTKEAGHSRNRIVHYYDYTGRHIAETMAKEVGRRQNVDCLDNCFLVDVLTQNERCCGCIVSSSGQLLILRAQVVVIATGGYSGIFNRSTNTVSSCGDGIAAAYRVGAAIADMEFVQFHPTAFTTLSGKAFLLTEALRGEGAVLRNAAGERFMFSYHPNGELAPRDEVSRAMVSEMKLNKEKCIYLDARHLGKEYLADRFRQVYSELARNGYSLERDLIPVVPTAHYTIGGIRTDLWGKTTVQNLYACGEAAATGVHGANRLASNSLLEGVVFGRRVAQSLDQDFPQEKRTGFELDGKPVCYGNDTREVGMALDRVAGVVRTEEKMSSVLGLLRQGFSDQDSHSPRSIKEYHSYNACQLAELLLEAALLRCESRGTHYRVDYPDKNDASFHKHVIQQWGRGAVLQ